MNNSNPIIQCSEIAKGYRIGKNTVNVLKNLNLEIQPDSWNAILGASGSGKTTLLHLLGGLEKPDSGNITVKNAEYIKMSSGAIGRFRAKEIGFVFQAYHLLPELSVLENVMLPGLFAGLHAAECRKRAAGLIDKVGLAGRSLHRPKEMSGGEQQRCAIARALINQPEIILADEPTGNLDKVTGGEILKLFQSLREESGNTIVMITHSEVVARCSDRIFYLENGEIVS